MSASAWVFDVTEKDFEKAVLEKSKEIPVVVDFWAPWCGPCRTLGPALERHVEQRKGDVLLAKVNTDEQQRLAMAFQVQALPTVIAFRDGKPILEFEGALPDAQLAGFFDQICPTEADKETTQAHHVEKDNPDEAERMYRDALAKDPNQESAVVGLARILIERNRDAEATELLERLGAGGEQSIEADKLHALIWLRSQTNDLPDENALRGRVQAEPKDSQGALQLGLRLARAGKHAEALETLLALGERDFKLAPTKVKEAMVKIFQIVGPQDPLSNAYRAKLAALLY